MMNITSKTDNSNHQKMQGAVLLDFGYVTLSDMDADAQTTVGENLGIWTEQRLVNLISDKVEENLGLEYKAADALEHNRKDEITKDVSAFANSAGGTVIIGIAEHSTCHPPLRSWELFN